MQSWKENYQRWLSSESLDPELKQQLKDMEGNPSLLEDCFYKELEFGTGGMRGEIGPGTNRLNIYTIRKAALGLARYIINSGEQAKERGVVIAFDSRHKSPEFAMEAAKTLATNGVKAYIFDALRPTPLLSFAVRFLNASGGIVITASHNPPEYNGFKVYGEDGGQIPPATADQLIKFVQSVGNELGITVNSEKELKEQGLIQICGKEIDNAYIEHLLSLRINEGVIEKMSGNIKIVFSPLHGTAYHPVKDGLSAFGFKNVTIVKEQALPDPQFSTVKSPNPEEHEAFELAIQYGKAIDADILLATDPDADRIGVAVKKDDGEYTVLTGNQTGALLLYYILTQKKEAGELPANGVVLKTIVTSELGREIANSFGVKTVDTLTGFKFIGEKINEYKKSGEFSFLFGYEESYGYLIGDFVRDKDAVQAALVACEAAAYYKAMGKSLYEVLHEIFAQYGYYKEDLVSITLKGKNGAEQIDKIMEDFRLVSPEKISGKEIIIIEDYLSRERIGKSNAEKSIIALPKSNVLKYILEDGSWFCLRPSGTEPKIKFYFGVNGKSVIESEQKLKGLKQAVMAKVNAILNDEK